MHRWRSALALAAALALLGAAQVPAAAPPVEAPVAASSEAAADKPTERKYYIETADDAATLKAGLAAAKAEGKWAVVVFGADWCHDSRALARVLTSPAFTREFGARFTPIFIDVGVPSAGQGRNLDLVKRYGLKQLKGIPALFVISPKGKRINSPKDAQSWRNAESRGEAAILQWFRDLKIE